MQQQNRIEFVTRPVEISIECSVDRHRFADIAFSGQKDGTLRIRLNDQEINDLFRDDVEPMYNKYKITIENITEQQKPHELLQIAATSAKLGNVKLAVEQAIKAMQKLAE